MISQVRFEFPTGMCMKDKGDFLEDLFRALMERQRYEVTSRINFTGTEIDLLCEHKDRASERMVVECKAKISLGADDLKKFSYDVIVAPRDGVTHGYFVHTSELQHSAAGVRDDLEKNHAGSFTFVGPAKLIEMLVEASLIRAPRSNYTLTENAYPPTKQILLYTPEQKAWVTVYSKGTMASHFSLEAASDNIITSSDSLVIKEFLKEELQNLSVLPTIHSACDFDDAQRETDVVADVQESVEWSDLRPVGSKFFVGRDVITRRLYDLVKAPLGETTPTRVFFVEGKSGWGKSSLLAHLRARSRNKRNKNTLFTLLVDTRSASTSAFVGLSVLKLFEEASKAKFIPHELVDNFKIPSWFDILSEPSVAPLFQWLEDNRRVLVLAFDQFEDVFRKHDLFKAFHKFMLDVDSSHANLVLGFSWKSEISIPIDNPAYNLWQQAREHSTSCEVEKFRAAEVERVIAQLQKHCGHPLTPALKRRLKEGSQGFPWLIKKLATHCYNEMGKGLNPDDLVDQDLNVKDLFDKDREALSPDEARTLKLIAQRGYDGDSFDVSEVGEQADDAVLNRLLSKRLVIRAGSKYNVYWDIFRDYLVEEKPPRLDESFLLRQRPTPLIEALKVLLSSSSGTFNEICQQLKISEGTALNLVRELRNVGAVTLREGRYSESGW